MLQYACRVYAGGHGARRPIPPQQVVLWRVVGVTPKAFGIKRLWVLSILVGIGMFTGGTEIKRFFKTVAPVAGRARQVLVPGFRKVVVIQAFIILITLLVETRVDGCPLKEWACLWVSSQP